MSGTSNDDARGLSPRVRGNQIQAVNQPCGCRSIPACAGEPCGYRSTPIPRRVYPRVCGGTQLGRSCRWSNRGLSPRVRGNQVEVCPRCRSIGSIPACAGEPSKRPRRRRMSRVYPRVCGGTVRSWCENNEAYGLSPRVRGNPVQMDVVLVLQGSIPACAGEPIAWAVRRRARAVYPRVCGGTAHLDIQVVPSNGLSPRVRGNPGLLTPASVSAGSIPACAGEPSSKRGWSVRTTVYPRVCGGTPAGRTQTPAEYGLSPRVRGNQQRPQRNQQCPGSIPACAGEPSA